MPHTIINSCLDFHVPISLCIAITEIVITDMVISENQNEYMSIIPNVSDRWGMQKANSIFMIEIDKKKIDRIVHALTISAVLSIIR